MSQSLAQNYVHLIFSTKNREKWISSDLQARLNPYLAKACSQQGSPALKVGGVEDHVHILLRLSKNEPLAKVIGSIKGESSKWIKSAFPELSMFAWQAGYGAFSVSASKLDVVTQYIADQAEHHRTKDFKEEYREFLVRHDVDFDERYVWD